MNCFTETHVVAENAAHFILVQVVKTANPDALMLEQTVVLVGGQTEPISQVVFICFLVEPETTFLITDRQILIRIIFLIRGGRMLCNRISFFNFFLVLATKLAFLGDGFIFCSFFFRFAVVNKVRLILVLGSPAFFLVFGVV